MADTSNKSTDKPADLPPMEYRFLGRSGLQVSALSLGGWLTYGGHVDREGTFACMKAAYDCGVNLFDTAEVYADGESEVVMGEAIRRFKWERSEIVVTTKLYWGTGSRTRPENTIGLSRKHIVEGMRQSLARLQLDYVDVVFAHRPDRHTPMEETVRAFNHLIDTGKTLYWGTSEWNADEIAQAWRVADRLGLVGPLAEQPAYNMIDRSKVELEFAHLYRDPGLGLTVWSPMKQGVLSGKYKNGIPDDSRFAQTQVAYVQGFWKRTDKAEWDEVVAQVTQLEPIADRLGTKLSVLAIAWVLANPNISTALLGASSPAQIYENVQALALYKKLTPDILAEIDSIFNNKPPTIVMRVGRT